MIASYLLIQSKNKEQKPILKNNKELITSDSSKPSTTDNVEIIKLDIKKYNATFKTDNFNIITTKNEENTDFISYIFNSNGDNYEGLCQINIDGKSKKIGMNDFTKINVKSPFTVHQLGSKTSTDKSFLFIGGTINKKEIKMLNLEFSDGSVVTVQIGENASYNCLKILGNIQLKKIIAFDDAQKQIYEYPSSSF